MLTVAVASGDLASSAELLAILEQTGKVKSVRQWSVPADKLPDAAEGIPDVVFLDLGRNPDPFLDFASHLRRNWPAVRVIACSANVPPNPQLLLDAMRSGVQDFIAKPMEGQALTELLNRISIDVQGKELIGNDRLIIILSLIHI